jgi:glycogen debranching enzyme
LKKLFLFCLLLSSISYSQYEDTGKRGIYFSKNIYVDKPTPTFEANKDNLPSPILEDKPEWIKLYWKAWELAFEHFKQPPMGSPFVSNYLDEAFAPQIFQWDTFFMIMFARYANHIFPAIESLDNFYCRQYENGYICREIVEATGEDFVFEGREHTVNPPLFSWAEIENFKITGDKSRFEAVLPVLEKYAEWLEKHRKKENTTHDLYWQTGLGSGMDNTPRSGSGWVDMSAQMVMMYNDMAKMCNELGLKEKENLFCTKAKEISEHINKFMWNEGDGLYYDVDDEGNQIKWKTAACFWPMLAGIADLHQAVKLLANLKDPNSFWRKIPFPSLAADQKNYAPDGKYWLGSVWAPTNVMILKGLDKYSFGNDNAFNFNEFSSLATEEYLNGINEVYKRTGTIWENYSPDSYSRGVWSRPDFVGWSGCGPIQLLIENIIGLRPNSIDNSLTWYLTRIDKHGIANLRFGDVTISIVSERRESIYSPVSITTTTDKPFSLIIRNSWGDEKVFNLDKGKHSINFKL